MKTSLSIGRSAALITAAMLVAVAALAWQIETIDTGRFCGRDCSITVNEDDLPHISYYRYDNPGLLRYAQWIGMWWITETVDSSRAGEWTSIALDRSGRAHISYQERHTYLKYACLTDSGWVTERIDNNPGVAEGTSIAVDDSGRPHIAYHAASGVNLKYASVRDGEWFIETVDSVGHVGRHPSLALKQGMIPYISYLDGNSLDLKLAWRDGDTWQFERVDTAGSCGWSTDIAFGPDGYPQIVYHAKDPNHVRVAKWTGSEWTIESLGITPELWATASIALDSYGFAHIACRETLSDALKHVYWNGSSWDSETIDEGDDHPGTYSSITVDGQNNVHVAYTAYLDTLYIDSELRYARREPTAVAEGEPTGRHLDYRLHQSKPNPFHKSTTISYSLPTACHVRLHVYELTGRLVATLVDEQHNAGIHQMEWLPERMPAAVYFCRLQAGEFVRTRKMLLVR